MGEIVVLIEALTADGFRSFAIPVSAYSPLHDKVVYSSLPIRSRIFPGEK
jgi:hypothetical protein